LVAEDRGSLDRFSQPRLRDNAYWYPAVPPQDLLLNEESLIGVSPLPLITTPYQAAPWILFGGLQGELFPHLTMVSFSGGRTGKLHSIRFHYDGLPDVRIQIDPRPIVEVDNIQRFFVDGQGGETITTLTVFNSSPHRPLMGREVLFGITTNRGRSFLFHPSPESVRSRFQCNLRIAPGSTLVGLFLSQVRGILCSCTCASTDTLTGSGAWMHRLGCNLGRNTGVKRLNVLRAPSPG
jgi:hypothetical protein